MKKLPLLIVISIYLSLTACGGGSSDGSIGGNGSGGENTIVTSQATPIETKSISTTWDIPTTKVNGEPLSLSEIGGYKIYISTNNVFPPSLPHVKITNGAIAEYTINNLPSGTYYIYITTFDVNGDESPYSDPVAKTV